MLITLFLNQFKTVSKFSNNGNYYYLDNILQTKKAIMALHDSGIMNYTDSAFSAQIATSLTDRFILEGRQYNIFRSESTNIKYVINVMYKWLGEYVPTEETETIINIKLPQINTLSDFAASAGCIKKALSQLIPEVGGNINVKQLDHGSYWLIIDVETIEAVALVGALAAAAYRIAVKIISIRKSIEELKSIRLDNQLKELQIEEKEYIKAKAKEEAERINQEQFGNTKDEDPANFNERNGRISVSIEELVKIIRAGGEIHQSLEAPKTISELYPQYNTSLSFTPIAVTILFSALT